MALAAAAVFTKRGLARIRKTGDRPDAAGNLLPRVTVSRLLVVATALGMDLGCSLRLLDPARGHYWFGGWGPIYLDLIVLHIQASFLITIVCIIDRNQRRNLAARVGPKTDAASRARQRPGENQIQL